MSPILKRVTAAESPPAVPFAFRDLEPGEAASPADAQRMADEIVARAQAEAEGIRREAARMGRADAAEAALRAARRKYADEVTRLAAVVGAAAAEVRESRHAWLAHWESAALRLAREIAARVIRREVHDDASVTTTLIREALELAAGASDIRLRLHPADCETFGATAQIIAAELAGLGRISVVADATITPGGCRVDTRFGSIDQQFETQLARIEEELA